MGVFYLFIPEGRKMSILKIILTFKSVIKKLRLVFCS
jgi:hypothetical protein